MKVFRNIFPALAGALLTAGTAVAAADNATSEHPVQTTTPVENTMKIVIETDQQTLTATLFQDSAAARDFVALLPLQLTLTDYAATEKISDLPGRLSTDGEPSGTAAKAGDITYYAPWGNLAIFHKSFRHSAGLVKLGTLDNGVELMRSPGPLDVTIRLP